MSFIENIKSKITTPSKIAGVEVLFLPDGGTQLNVTIITKNKNTVTVELCQTNLTEIDELKKHIDIAIPLSLVFNGRGLIHKSVEITEKDEDKTLIRKVIPNANIKDFYVQTQIPVDAKGFVSIARKNTIDKWISAFKDSGYFIISSFIGPFTLAPISSILNPSAPQQIKLGNHSLLLNGGYIEDYLVQKEGSFDGDINIGEETLMLSGVVAFSAAFCTSQNLNVPSLQIEIVLADQEDFGQKLMFTTIGWGMLVFFLLILMGNFFLYQSLDDKKKQVISQNEQYSGLGEERDRLKKETEEKEAFLTGLGISDNFYTTFYADRIIQSVPGNISLTEFTVNPLSKKIKKNEKIRFNNSTILISGECTKSKDLNIWLKYLKDFEWVKKTIILKYEQSSSLYKGKFDIELTIEK